LASAAAFWAAAASSLANGCYGLMILPESLRLELRRPFDWRRANPLGSLKLLRSHPELTGLASVSFLANLAHNSLPAIFVLYTMYRYDWTQKAIGLTLTSLLNLWLAALIAHISGRLKRPWPAIAQMTFPPFAPTLLAIAVAGTFLSDLIGLASSVMTASLLLAYALLGFAVMHAITTGIGAFFGAFVAQQYRRTLLLVAE
jgi:hypothetical protein